MATRSALWVEDHANHELANLAAAVWDSGRYDLTIAENASEALSAMEARPFDAIVVDIRLPPGPDRRWLELLTRPGVSAAGAKLGLMLLRSVLCPTEAMVRSTADLSWISPEKISVLTIESTPDLRRELERLGIRAVREKKAFLPERTLLDMFDAMSGEVRRRASGRVI